MDKFHQGTVSESDTGPLDYGATVPDSETLILGVPMKAVSGSGSL